MREKWNDSILSGCLVERGERKIGGGARVFSLRTHQRVFSPIRRKLERRKAQFELNKMPTCMVGMGIIHLFLPFLFYFWCCIDILAFLFFFFFFFFFFWAGRVLAICFFFSFFLLLLLLFLLFHFFFFFFCTFSRGFKNWTGLSNWEPSTNLIQ